MYLGVFHSVHPFCYRGNSERDPDFVEILRKRSCENISLLYLTFIELLGRFIKVLATLSSLEVSEFSLASSSNFESKEAATKSTAILMQNNFSRIKIESPEYN